MTDSGGGPVRIAALGDLHHAKSLATPDTRFLSQLSDAADVLVLCGDLTDTGLPDEAHELAQALSQTVRIPIVGVLGNHDYESGQEAEVRRILTEAGVTLLDGEACEIRGIGFAGVKGFAGGFGRGTLGPWGETIVKAFVQEAVNEALKLETALARLRTPHKIAVLHYAPIAATAEGEPREIFPFLGCSRLEDPINRYPVSAVFHGHAHHGAAEGRTSNGSPVYNVSLPLLQSLQPNQPFRVTSLG
jgi:Icc-related predicted phosphoesterase